MIDTIFSIGDEFPSCLTLVQVTGRRGNPCIYANRKFFENTGYDPKFAIGKNLSFYKGSSLTKKLLVI